MTQEAQKANPDQSPEYWMERLKEGHEEALAHLMARFERPVLSFINRKLQGEAGAAQELAQDVFLKCLQHCRRFEAGRPVAAWIFTLAANTAIDYLRKTKRGMEVQAGQALDAFHDHDAPSLSHVSRWEAADRQGRLDSLHAAIGDLTQRQRAMVMAYYIQEHPVRNIAERFACAEGTVKATLFQSLAKLRKSMGQQP
jgi:RNA polymerase sigma-70 factor (ECF subfamily)